MGRKSSQKRIEANRRNALKSTGPRTAEGKARSSANATTHGLSSLKAKPLGPGCFLHIEDEAAYESMLAEYVDSYQPQQRHEMDLLREAVYAKFRQQRGWHGETGQLEIAIAQNELDLQRSLPSATAQAHLANGFAHSEAMVRLYLRYDAQLHRHSKSCFQQLNDLQDRRRAQTNPDRKAQNPEPGDPNPVEPPNEPTTPTEQTNTARQQADPNLGAPNEAIEPPTAASPKEANPSTSPAREQGDNDVAERPNEAKTVPLTDAEIFEQYRDRLIQRYRQSGPKPTSV